MLSLAFPEIRVLYGTFTDAVSAITLAAGRSVLLLGTPFFPSMPRREGDPPPSEPASWAEAIKQYHKEKKTRPRPDEEYKRPEYITQFQKTREAVEYHPILQTFRDGARESDARQHEASARVKQINAARDRQIAQEQPFDILTFANKRASLPQPKPLGATDMLKPFDITAERPTFRHPLDSCYQFNILTNLPLSEQHYAEPKLRPNVREPLPTTLTGVEVRKPRLQNKSQLPRDFDILSNRYVEGHESKVRLEREIQRGIACQKFWETHDYEPLAGHFVDPDKEAAYQDMIAMELEKQPLKQFNRLPPNLQRGEGFVYDITTHQVKNEELYQKESEKQARKTERDSLSWSRAEQQRNHGLERAELAERRAVNRQSHQRYVETFRHGYNIVDHRDYRDPATYMPPPQTRPQPTLWQAVGPNRPPLPPPVPPPPPAIAPLLSTMPTDGPWAETTGRSLAMSMARSGRSMPGSLSQIYMSASMPAPRSTASSISKLAEYEARE